MENKSPTPAPVRQSRCVLLCGDSTQELFHNCPVIHSDLMEQVKVEPTDYQDKPALKVHYRCRRIDDKGLVAGFSDYRFVVRSEEYQTSAGMEIDYAEIFGSCLLLNVSDSGHLIAELVYMEEDDYAMAQVSVKVRLGATLFYQANH